MIIKFNKNKQGWKVGGLGWGVEGSAGRGDTIFLERKS